MRKTSKERREEQAQIHRITMAEAAKSIKETRPKTFSATNPPYAYMSLCPDPSLWTSPACTAAYLRVRKGAGEDSVYR
ncbi:hypothetical protein [Lacrimispora sp.]|uniref:hypothetical protein n=1 Tax=Lacrimispora sp. TaxID=2719234 RepID=UPI002FD904BA